MASIDKNRDVEGKRLTALYPRAISGKGRRDSALMVATHVPSRH